MKKDQLDNSHILHVDYKDVTLLKNFVDQHGKIMSRRRSGLTALNHRKVTQGIKRARFMGLMPYIQA